MLTYRLARVFPITALIAAAAVVIINFWPVILTSLK